MIKNMSPNLFKSAHLDGDVLEIILLIIFNIFSIILDKYLMFINVYIN
jgi:hypothetical protein